MGRTFWEYVKLLVWPSPLYIERQLNYVTELEIGLVGMVVGLLVMGYLGWREYKAKKSVWIGFGLGWVLFFVLGVVFGLAGLFLGQERFFPSGIVRHKIVKLRLEQSTLLVVCILLSS